jgi:hypothetical protein
MQYLPYMINNAKPQVIGFVPESVNFSTVRCHLFNGIRFVLCENKLVKDFHTQLVSNSVPNEKLRIKASKIMVSGKQKIEW